LQKQSFLLQNKWKWVDCVVQSKDTRN